MQNLTPYIQPLWNGSLLVTGSGFRTEKESSEISESIMNCTIFELHVYFSEIFYILRYITISLIGLFLNHEGIACMENYRGPKILTVSELYVQTESAQLKRYRFINTSWV